VFYTEPEVGARDRPVASPSVAQLVRWWVEALDSGGARFDRSTNRWQSEPAKLPEVPHGTLLL
jgi:hypothetical protein